VAFYGIYTSLADIEEIAKMRKLLLVVAVVISLIVIGSIAFAERKDSIASVGVTYENNLGNIIINTEISPQIKFGNKSYLEFAFGSEMQKKFDNFQDNLKMTEYYGGVNLYIDFFNIKVKSGTEESTVRIGVDMWREELAAPGPMASIGATIDVNNLDSVIVDTGISPQFKLSRNSYLEVGFGYQLCFPLPNSNGLVTDKLGLYAGVNLYIDFFNIKAKYDADTDSAAVRVGFEF